MFSLVLCVACTKEEGPPQVRGAGFPLASLDVSEQAAVNGSALSAAFDPDPSLSLLIDPVYLPRTAGRLGGASVAPALIARMKQGGSIRGICQTPRDTTRTVPVCPAPLPGYVVRFSEVFQLGADSVEVYLGATRYRRAPKEPAEVLRFERAYQLVRVKGEWRVMREARLPNRNG
ncbi:MAG: hypothetical protein JWL95_1213 [Gemmatimonadetes bacterium]|nr:hypothetical protein [Gemmatimonadota bacterium]